MIHQPISRKQRLLQKLHNKPLPDVQRSTNVSTVDPQSVKPKVGLHRYICLNMYNILINCTLSLLIKDDKLITSSNKLDCKKVDDKSTANDMLSQIINESLMDNTSPLPSQFPTNSYYKHVCE